ncbi:hypothetical protein RDI58_013256 [Solanum bulbocastanum]|uniref:3-hydroxyacyl-CoA dehydrogenase NAD binding domain-containing protein n=1 Tax=Solanum bulbocastanum TaxID=147425 RepID=A0AAN8TT97_SOLBU
MVKTVSNHRRGYFDLFRLHIAKDNMKGNRRINYGWYMYIPLKIEKVVVIGGGLMGSGIATTLILSSIQVILKEINFDYLQKSLKSIDVSVIVGLKLASTLVIVISKVVMHLISGFSLTKNKESFFDNREISDVAYANEVHLSSSCVSKSDGNGNKLSTLASAMAPSSSSTGSTTTSTTQRAGA